MKTKNIFLTISICAFIISVMLFFAFGQTAVASTATGIKDPAINDMIHTIVKRVNIETASGLIGMLMAFFWIPIFLMSLFFFIMFSIQERTKDNKK